MRIVVSDFINLDGVVQAPGGRDEDTDGGFSRDGEALQVMGSASLAAQLVAHGLVDEYRLMVEPILLGGGKRLLPDDGVARALELVSATTTATGVLICTYRPAVG